MSLRFLILLPALFLPKFLVGYSWNPPNGMFTESTNCRSCHNSYSLNSGSGSISLSGLPSSYTPGQTYDLSLIFSGTSLNSYGFQLAAQANMNTSGTLSAVSSDMSIDASAAEHRGASSSGIWNFQWTAPATDEGSVSFYAVGVAGNGGGSSGDYVYTASENLSAAATESVSMEWNASTGGVIFSSPTIGSNGAIYVGSNDNKLHAFHADGSPKWTFNAENWVDSTPAIGPDGTIYVGSWDNKVYAINPSDGSKQWEFETNSYVIASPSVGADGKIYVGSKDSIFYALESNGSLAWEYFAGQPISSSAALGQDGSIYFGDENGTLHALHPDGSSKWTYVIDEVADTNKSILSSPALDLSGNIYFGSGNGYCYSLADNENNATLNWQFLTGDRVDASPILGATNDVFFVSRDGYLRSLSSLTGGLNWDAFVGDVFYSAPVIDSNGRVYVIGYTGGGENHLSAFESNGTKAWDTNQSEISFSVAGIVDSSLLLSESGKLYYGCYDGKLYCVDIGSGPATSDWPMFQGNGKRDGAWPSYTLEISANSDGYGQVSGAGIYNPGSTVTITATPATGHSFESWSGSGPADPSSASTTIEMTEDRNLSAVFTVNSYQINITVSPTDAAVIQGAGIYPYGETATLSVSSLGAGYQFESWSGGISGNSDPLTFSVNQDSNITANFEIINYELNVTVASGGTVSGSGLFPYGNLAQISATPSDGYTFSGWTGSGVTDPNSASTTVSMTEARNITASFTLNTYALNISTTGQGSVTGAGTYSHGDLVTISAVPSTGFSFLNWEGNGISDIQSATTTVSMTEDRNITAIFGTNSYSLLVSAGNGGTVTGSGTFSYGSEASIEAIPATGYSFVSWFGHNVDSVNAPQTTVSMTQDISLSAIFEIDQFTLSPITTTGGTITGGGTYEYGTMVNINAIPDSEYLFVRWEGVDITDKNSSSTTIVINQNQQITAVFEAKPLEEKSLILTSSPNIAGTTSGSGSYPMGLSVAISATPSTGYAFSHWSGGNFDDPNSSSTEVIIHSDSNATAHFSPLTFTLEINASLGGSGTGSGTYDFGTEVSISAIPENGYHFKSWHGAGIDNPLLETVSILMDQDLNISLSFEVNQYTLSLSTNNSGGIVEGGGTFTHGTTASIRALPSDGYEFLGWSGENLESNSEKNILLSMDTNYELTANFGTLTVTSISGINDLGSNWYSSDWLGYFHFTNENWCYHMEIGWLYIVPIDDDSLWAWSPQLGWLWLSSVAFGDGLAWSRDDGDWLYFSFAPAGSSRIYHYQNQVWTSFDPNEAVSLEKSLF